MIVIKLKRLQGIKKIEWPKIVALFSFLVFCFWIFLMFDAAPRFQEVVGTNSLAMIDVLFPYFWIILVAFVGICFSTFFKVESPGWLYILLISQLSLMLFFTPFLLSGFSWSPDSLWHGGIARHLPEILSGSKFVFSQYAQSYPVSFFTTYLATSIAGISVFSYTLYIYPLFTSMIIPILAYFFVARIFNNKIGFLALLFTLPALHYFEPHVSPFSFGTILVFVSLILLTYKNRLPLILSFLTIILLIFSHPISPISLGGFFFAYLVVGFLFRRSEKATVQPTNFWFSRLFILFIVWFSWTLYYASLYYPGVENAVASIFNLSFFNRIFNVTQFTIGNQGFIYPEIHQLSLVIYGLFLVFVLLPFFEYLLSYLSRFRNMKVTLAWNDKMAFSFAAIFNAVLGFFLFLSSGERFLLGRGLLYLIIFGSAVFATYFVSSGQLIGRGKRFLAFGLIVFLCVSFPLATYSKETYNSFTPSADAGLRFISSKVNFTDKSLSMGVDQQLAAYLDLPDSFVSVEFPPNMSAMYPPDVIVLRINSYWVISMRYDFSFTNNSYTILEEDLARNFDYSKIYSNSRFEVYVRPS